eukprot:m51a1_g6628 putative tyrosine (1129) ;mRNA; f:61481-66260
MTKGSAKKKRGAASRAASALKPHSSPRQSPGASQHRPHSQRSSPAGVSISGDPSAPASSIVLDSVIPDACAECSRNAERIAKLQAELREFAEQRSIADSRHERFVEEAAKRDQIMQEIIDRLKAEKAELQNQLSAAQAEVACMSGAVTPELPVPVPLNTAAAPATPVKTPTKTAQKTPMKTPGRLAVHHTPSRTPRPAVRREAIAPPPSEAPMPPVFGCDAEAEAESARYLARTVELYRELSAVTVSQRDATTFECTCYNRRKERGVQFTLYLGQSMVEYAPVTIEPELNLPEVFSSPIEFERSQLPVFLGQLLTEMQLAHRSSSPRRRAKSEYAPARPCATSDAAAPSAAAGDDDDDAERRDRDARPLHRHKRHDKEKLSVVVVEVQPPAPKGGVAAMVSQGSPRAGKLDAAAHRKDRCCGAGERAKELSPAAKEQPLSPRRPETEQRLLELARRFLRTDEVKRDQNGEKLREIAASITNLTRDAEEIIARRSHMFLHSGPLSIILSAANRPPKKRYFWLFDDCLVMAAYTGKPQPPFTLSGILSCPVAVFVDDDPSPVFEVLTRARKLTLVATSVEDRNAWVDALRLVVGSSSAVPPDMIQSLFALDKDEKKPRTSLSTYCPKCGENLSYPRNRRVCGYCGKTVCAMCAEWRILPGVEYTQPVCQCCFLIKLDDDLMAESPASISTASGSPTSERHLRRTQSGYWTSSSSSSCSSASKPADAVLRRSVTVSPKRLEFGLGAGQAPVDSPVRDVVTIENRSASFVAWKVGPRVSERTFELAFEPSHSIVDPGATARVDVELRVRCTTHVKASVGLELRAEGAVWSTAVTLELDSQLSTRLDREEIEVSSPPIGEGSFGTVYKADYRGLDVAVKILKGQDQMPEDVLDQFNREVHFLEHVRHPCIVNLIGYVTEAGHLALVTEYCPHGNLTTALRRKALTLPMKLKCLVDCAKGMAFLHRSNIMHRDLKPSNLLLVSTEVRAPVMCKLSDFGTVRDINPTSSVASLTERVGSPIWMAPEVISGSKYEKSCDVFSFAVILYEVLTGEIPYCRSVTPEGHVSFWKSAEIRAFVLEGKRPPIPPQIPRPCVDLITLCWAQDPAARLGFTDVLQRLEEWLNKHLSQTENVKH